MHSRCADGEVLAGTPEFQGSGMGHIGITLLLMLPENRREPLKRGGMSEEQHIGRAVPCEPPEDIS